MSNFFDDKLEQINGLTWLPYIGDDYKAGASPLILGESHYSYNNKPIEEIEKTRDETIGCLTDYIESGRAAGNQYKTYEPMESVLQNSVIGEETREKLWKRLAFMNLIQSCMGDNSARPHWELFLNGWEVVLQVINAIRPRVCICFSTDKMHNRVNFNRLEEFKGNLDFSYSIAPNEDTEQRISRCIVARPGRIDIGNYSCPVIFVRHASRIKGQAIMRWSQVIDSALQSK